METSNRTSTVRTILAVIAGFIVAALATWALELLGHRLYPSPPGIDPFTPEGAERFIASLPPQALMFVLLAWFVGSLLGTLTAVRIGRRALPAWIVCGLVVAGGGWSMFTLPHPAWMIAAGLSLPVLATLLVVRRFVPR